MRAVVVHRRPFTAEMHQANGCRACGHAFDAALGQVVDMGYFEPFKLGFGHVLVSLVARLFDGRAD